MNTEDIVLRFQQAGIEIAKCWSDGTIFFTATYVERRDDGTIDWDRTLNSVMFDYYEDTWQARYLVGQVGCTLKAAQNPELVIQALISFYKMGEREHEKLHHIGKSLCYFQFNGLSAYIENETTIAVGVYNDPIEKPTYEQMIDAARSTPYTITDYIHKETETWTAASVSSHEKSSFKSVAEATEHLLDKLTKGKRRRGW
jgi:hypothetical protein